MKFTQYYLDCLSQASYLIGDETTGRAVVVDPRRDIDEYVRDATEAGLTIELVIETHFHADFLSGHLELAQRWEEHFLLPGDVGESMDQHSADSFDVVYCSPAVSAAEVLLVHHGVHL